MDDLFSDLNNDDYLDETSPMGDLPGTGQMDDLPETQPLSVDDDEFDMLRQKSVRTETTYSGMETADDEFSGSGFSLKNFSTSQKLILLSLLMLDIVAVGFGVMVLLGIV